MDSACHLTSMFLGGQSARTPRWVRGEMRRRAAARRYEISESVAIKWLERVERHGSREPVGHGGHRASKLMAHRDFLKGCADREDRHHAFRAVRFSFVRAR